MDAFCEAIVDFGRIRVLIVLAGLAATLLWDGVYSGNSLTEYSIAGLFVVLLIVVLFRC